MGKITAKFASVCPSCNRSISPGDQVNWELGRAATHVGCSSGRASRPPRTTHTTKHRPAQKPAKRGLTQAQLEANRKTFDACPATITGRYSKGDIVRDYNNVLYRVETYGIRYHEDASSCLYGIKPLSRPTPQQKASLLLTSVARLTESTIQWSQAPGSRGGWKKTEDGKYEDITVPVPPGKELVRWKYSEPNSMASFPWIVVQDNSVVRVFQPNYDDSPTEVWVQDSALANSVASAIELCPTPIYFAVIHPSFRAKEEVS